MGRLFPIASILALAACGEAAAPPVDAGASDVDAGSDAGPADGWRAEAPLPTPAQEIAAAAHDGRIWVAGGLEGTVVVPHVRVYDPATEAWSSGPDLPAPRHHLCLVSHRGALYALGGMETLSFSPVDTAWVLAAGADAWAPIAPLPLERGAAAAASVGDLIVLAGGNESRGGLADATLRYDPAADAWSLGAAIPTPREHLAAVAVDGELYVLAGRRNSLTTNLATLEIYDPIADAWRAGPPLPTARGGFGAAELDGAIYATGGELPDSVHRSVDRLDLATGVWSASAPMPTPHHGHGTVALAGRLWVIGGGDVPNLGPTDVVESWAPAAP